MAGSRLRRWHVWLAVLPPLALALAGTVYLSLDPSELWPELDWQPPQASSEVRAPFDLAGPAAVDSSRGADLAEAPARPAAAAQARPLPREVRRALALAGHELDESEQTPPAGSAIALLQALEHAERGGDALQLGRALEHLRRHDELSAAHLAQGLERASLSESRVALVRALALTGAPEVPETLARQAERDPDDAVRQECLVLLVSLGESERAQALLEDLSAREPATFARFARVFPRLPALRPLLLEAFRAEASPELVRAATWSLVAGPGQAPAVVLEAALAPDARALSVTEGLIRALPRSEPTLRAVTTQSASPSACACALRGLIRAGCLSPEEALALCQQTSEPELIRIAQTYAQDRGQ